MKLKNLAFLTLMAFTFTGCVETYLSTETTDDPLKPKFILSSSDKVVKPIRVNRLVIREIGSENADKLVWRLSTERQGNDPLLGILVYGEVPESFEEDEKAISLKVGCKYSMEIYYGDSYHRFLFDIVKTDGIISVKME